MDGQADTGQKEVPLWRARGGEPLEEMEGQKLGPQRVQGRLFSNWKEWGLLPDPP